MAEDRKAHRGVQAGRPYGRPPELRPLELNWAGGDVYGRDLLDLDEVDSELLKIDAFSSGAERDLFSDVSMDRVPNAGRHEEWVQRDVVRHPQPRHVSPTKIVAGHGESSEYPPTLLELEVQALAKVGVLKLYHDSRDLENEKERFEEEQKLARIDRFDRERQALSPLPSQRTQQVQPLERGDLLELEKVARARMKTLTRPPSAPDASGGADLLELQKVALSNMRNTQKLSAAASAPSPPLTAEGGDLLELQKVALSTMKRIPPLLVPATVPPPNIGVADLLELQKVPLASKRNPSKAPSFLAVSTPVPNLAGVGELLELQRVALANMRSKQSETSVASLPSTSQTSGSIKVLHQGGGDLLELQKVALQSIPRQPAPVAALAPQHAGGGDLLELQKVALRSIPKQPDPVPAPALAPEEAGADYLLELQKVALRSILKQPAEALAQALSPASQPTGGGDLLELQKVALRSIPQQPAPVPGQALATAPEQAGGDLLELQKLALRNIPYQPAPAPAPAQAPQQAGGDLLELQKVALANLRFGNEGNANPKSTELKGIIEADRSCTSASASASSWFNFLPATGPLEMLLQDLSAKNEALQSANRKIEEKDELLQGYAGELAKALKLLESMNVRCTDAQEETAKVLTEAEEIFGNLNEACRAVENFEVLPECCSAPQCAQGIHPAQLTIGGPGPAAEDSHFFFGTENGSGRSQIEIDDRRRLIEELLKELHNIEIARKEAQRGVALEIERNEQLIVELQQLDAGAPVSQGAICDHAYTEPKPEERSRKNEKDMIDAEHCEHSYESPSHHSIENPCDHVYQTPCDHTYENPSNQASGKKCDHAYENPSDQTSEKPCDHAYENPPDLASEKPCEHAYKNPSDQASERPCDHTYENPSGPASDKPCDHAYESPPDQASERPCEHAYENPPGHVFENSCDHAYENPSKDSEKSCDHAYENPSNKASKKSCYHVYEDEKIGSDSFHSPMMVGSQFCKPLTEALAEVESKVFAQLQVIDHGHKRPHPNHIARASSPNALWKHLEHFVQKHPQPEDADNIRLPSPQLSELQVDLELRINELLSELERKSGQIIDLHKQIHQLQDALLQEQENSRKALIQNAIDSHSAPTKFDLEHKIKEIHGLHNQIHQLETSLHQEREDNRNALAQKTFESGPNPAFIAPDLRSKELNDLHQQLDKVQRELCQEKETNRKLLTQLMQGDIHKLQADALVRDEKVKQMQKTITKKEALWQVEKHEIMKSIDEYETRLLVKEEEAIKLAHELEMSRSSNNSQLSSGISVVSRLKGANDGSRFFQKQGNIEEGREILDLRCEVLSLQDCLEIKTQALKTMEKELGRSYNTVSELRSKLRQGQEFDQNSQRQGQNGDLIERLRSSEEKLQRSQSERTAMSKKIDDLSARCKYLEEIEHLYQEGSDEMKEQAIKELEGELERNVQIIKKMQARCSEYEARAKQAEAGNIFESGGHQRIAVGRIAENGTTDSQAQVHTKYVVQLHVQKEELAAECERLRSELVCSQEQVDSKNQLLLQLQWDMQSLRKRQSPSPRKYEPVVVSSELGDRELVSDNQKSKKPRTNALLGTSDLEGNNGQTPEVSTLRELLREQWKLQKVMEDRLNTMMDYVSDRVDEFEQMSTSDATSDSGLAPKAELNHFHVEAKLMKLQLEQQLQVLKGTLFTSVHQLEGAHQQIGGLSTEGQPRSNLSSQNMQLLVEKIALEDSAQTLQEKTSRLLNKLTTMRSEFGQSVAASDLSG